MLKDKKITTTIKINILFLFIILMSTTGCTFDKKENNTEHNDISVNYENTNSDIYNKYISEFKTVTTDNLYDYSSEKETFFLYTGRVTCPYCLEFVPKLYLAITTVQNNINDNIQILHLNSENPEDKNLEAYREENHIQYVPHFVFFDKGKLVDEFEMVANFSEKDIENFIMDNLKNMQEINH